MIVVFFDCYRKMLSFEDYLQQSPFFPAIPGNPGSPGGPLGPGNPGNPGFPNKYIIQRNI